MNQGRTVVAQLLAYAPHKAFARCVQRYGGNHWVRRFSCRDQFLVMAFAQLTYRESLRDIEVCLGALPEKLYHMGICGSVSKSTLADANEKRDWRIYADFAQILIGEVPFTQLGAYFVLRAKKSLQFRRCYSRPVDRTRGVFCDQAGVLSVPGSAEGYPEPLRRVYFHDLEDGKQITLLSNHFHLPALTIAELYRCRWQVELLFEWIKQDLRNKAFYGTSENAVKTQIWIAICVYVLVTILKKRLGTERSLSLCYRS